MKNLNSPLIKGKTISLLALALMGALTVGSHQARADQFTPTPTSPAPLPSYPNDLLPPGVPGENWNDPIDWEELFPKIDWIDMGMGSRKLCTDIAKAVCEADRAQCDKDFPSWEQFGSRTLCRVEANKKFTDAVRKCFQLHPKGT